MSLVKSNEFFCKRTGENITVNSSLHGNHVIRTVHRNYQGEAWTRFTIIPRKYFLTKIRKMHAAEKRWASSLSNSQRSQYWRDPRDFTIPRASVIGMAANWVVCCSWRGAGTAFAGDPQVIKRTKNFIVIAQSGGLDI